MSLDIEKRKTDVIKKSLDKGNNLYDILSGNVKLTTENPVMLLDTSWSMEDRYDGKALIDHLKDTVREYVGTIPMIAFNDQWDYINDFERLRPNGGTALYRPLKHCVEKQYGTIIIVSDGCPHDNLSMIYEMMASANIPVNGIIIGESVFGKSFMKILANITNGSYNDIKLDKDFIGKLTQTIKGYLT